MTDGMKAGGFLLALGLCLGSAGVSLGQGSASGGELQWLDEPTTVQPMRQGRAGASQDAFTLDSDAPGLVSEKAAVGKLDGGMLIAIDAKSADAEWPEVVRFDFSGEGNFEDAPALPLQVHSQSGGFSSQFEGQIEVTRDGQTRPVQVQGFYMVYNGGSYRHTSVSLTSAGEAVVDFAGEPRRVVVVDGDSNLELGDGPELHIRDDGSLCHLGRGDTVLVYPGADAAGQPSAKAFWGQPVQVGEQWYRLSLADGRLAAEPADVEVGRVAVHYPRWQVTLVGREHIVHLDGTSVAEEAVPADDYVVLEYQRHAKQGGHLQAMMYSSDAGDRRYVVEPGGRTEVAFGSPITGKVVVEKQQNGRQLAFDFQYRDVNGAKIGHIQLADGQPDAPTLKVLDGDGNEVYTGKFEYG
ncbi:MAG: hypothetical protein ACLFV3_04185 [Phycisphaeraceae bacterium]